MTDTDPTGTAELVRAARYGAETLLLAKNEIDRLRLVVAEWEERCLRAEIELEILKARKP